MHCTTAHKAPFAHQFAKFQLAAVHQVTDFSRPIALLKNIQITVL
ncbi:hypothetical protein P20480_0364 [Pseudoalteromonas sp. BSi20480]|jgi:hypothetical protein|nr:hypothetical protein P20480_0364 [Pseudoalteromonas sp. BSi20480]